MKIGAHLQKLEKQHPVVQIRNPHFRRVQHPARIGLAIHLNLDGVEKVQVGFEALNHEGRP